jgi:signal transduction histidine kinase
MLQQLVDLYQPSMDECHHQLTVDVEDHIVVEADSGLLNRVMSNLIENEIAHLPDGCRITIRLRSREGSAQLTVEDNGPGFPADIGTRAFERFVRGKQSRGHGLGLAFVDAIVRAHSGCARISSGPNGGAVVTLSLPAAVLHAA